MADAIATGLASSPNLRQARARIDLARLNLDAVGVQMNPTLNLGSSYNYQFQPVTRTESPLVRFLNALIPGLISTPQGNPNSIAGAATLQMLVTTFGRVHWETQAARLALQQSRSQYRSQLEAEIQSIQVPTSRPSWPRVNWRWPARSWPISSRCWRTRKPAPGRG